MKDELKDLKKDERLYPLVDFIEDKHFVSIPPTSSIHWVIEIIEVQNEKFEEALMTSLERIEKDLNRHVEVKSNIFVNMLLCLLENERDLEKNDKWVIIYNETVWS